MESFAAKYGPWALVTGASRGIGAEFARQLAERGLNIVLIATNTRLLREQKNLIERRYSVQTRVISLDLAREDILNVLKPATKNLEIGMLVCNAGLSTISPFLEQDEDELLRQFYINARAALVLTRHYGKPMSVRGRGGIILLSSASAMNGTGYAANYAGTKAYNLILAESLWYELGERGVDVLGFMPGCTKTPGFEAHNPDTGWLVTVMGAEETVAEALKSLGRKPSLIAGRMNRLMYAIMGRLFPRRQAVKMVGASMEKIFHPAIRAGRNQDQK
jgi:short-subunit dehydrogenase